MRPRSRPARTIAWSSKRLGSLEYCTVRRVAAGWRFDGWLLGLPNANSFVAHHEIPTDRKFNTRLVLVQEFGPSSKGRLSMEVKDGAWVVNGSRRNDLARCKDVDLEATPATSTLPIRRARLKVGQKVEITAAWVRLPSLDVVPLGQSYERLSARRYRYRSSTGFSAVLEVNSFGLVTRYGNVWEQVR